LIARLFRRLPVQNINPDEVVARGAAVLKATREYTCRAGAPSCHSSWRSFIAGRCRRAPPPRRSLANRRLSHFRFEMRSFAGVGDASIRGSNNELTITGQCSGLDLAGSNNRITVTLDCEGSRAAIRGSNNALTITGKCSDLDVTGANNRITGS